MAPASARAPRKPAPTNNTQASAETDYNLLRELAAAAEYIARLKREIGALRVNELCRERIPTVSLYYDQGKGERYRSLGCWPCTKSVVSDAKDVQEIIVELRSGRFANIAERSGRAQDKDDGGGLESLRRDGYM